MAISFSFFKKRIIRELKETNSKYTWVADDKADDLASELFEVQMDWLRQLGLINTSRIDFDITDGASNGEEIHGNG